MPIAGLTLVPAASLRFGTQIAQIITIFLAGKLLKATSRR